MTANHRLAVFALVVGALAIVGRYYTAAPPAARAVAEKAGNFFQYAFLPVAIAGEGDGEPIEATPECREAWGAILAIDFTHYGRFNDNAEPSFSLPRVDELFRRLEKIAAIRCEPTDRMRERLRDAVKNFHQDCADIEGDVRKRGDSPGPKYWGSSHDGGGVGEMCLRSLLEYRFAAATALNGARPASGITSLATLLNLFYDEARDPHRSYERLAKLLSRIQELEPRSYQAAMLFAQIAYAFWLQSPAAHDTFERAITYVELLGRDEYVPLELRVRQAARDGDSAKLRERATHAKHLGFAAMAGYYLAWADYLEGDRESAKKQLRDALVSGSGDCHWQIALAIDRLAHAAGSPFTERGISVGLFFLVPDEDGRGNVVAGSVDMTLYREEAYFENSAPDVVRALHDLRAFDQAKRRCADNSGVSRTELPPAMADGTPKYQTCVSQALDAWGSLEVSLNEP